ncbi:glycoside hydrolase family 3 protein [Lentisalinibacter salinarum]|uniref:glycoside hydrolase family 3 protein n=1 Tax=Lentisalinibacter salinarum TaxID=2992239 RepID=UPI0038690C0B
MEVLGLTGSPRPRSRLTFLALAVLALPACTATPAAVPGVPAGQWPHTLRTEADIPAVVAAMTLAEKAGQMVQADVSTATPEDVREYGLGSIISTVPEGDLGTTEAWREMFDAYQRAALATRTRIPIVAGIDAVHGHAYFDGPATILPHNIGIGATRNPALAKRLAEVTARELAATGIRWTFAPTIAVARDIRWGRTYEAFGETAELQVLFASPLIEGYQGDDLTAEEHVGATAKHFVAEGATEGGVDRGNAVITEEELRTVHLPGYIDAIESGAVSVMASFSSLNGEKIHGSKALLTDLLKDELGFDGVVLTDWEGVSLGNLTMKESLLAGIDMFMLVQSWKEGIPEIVRLVEEGEVPMSRIDDAVTRILRLKLRLGLFERPYSSDALADAMGSDAHRTVARQAVRESLVLLKNEGGILPLPKDGNVIVAGSHADNVAFQSGGWTKKWQGAHEDLYGHAARPVEGATSIIDGIRKVIGAERVIDAGANGVIDGADVAIVIVGEEPYAEGIGDREAEVLVLTDEQRDLIRAYHAQGTKVVAVLVSGRPLLVNEELERSAAFVAAWLPGSEGEGIAEVLFGDYGFKGRLGFSWPRSADQIPLNVGDEDYDPLFPYGFGLGYDPIP